ncbi:zinc transport system substrate-binding protein [Yoonia maricola]|uniref:High-affinity zinc uptake system protein ZnuA n=1 Tax=Yoonia maricola TaxID=420999 RepID=A0A2M8W154_9RHOB|nr:zinc ABC transporter substrate-binding protein [Yoonia maricola]PJI84661.1 zinc transport system substrate-binding protein [Yoonia maricola]
MTILRTFRTLFAAGLILFVAGVAMAQDRPRVVAVNYPLQYFAERLLGDAAEVVFPVPADVDPSFWRPSISDVSMIQSADLILLNGAGFAAWVDRVSLPRSKLVNTSDAIEEQFIVTESMTHSHGDGGEHSHEALASYTWLDPTLATSQADAIAAAIVSRGLASQDQVDARLEILREDFQALDTQAATALGALEGTDIIATHPRYQYLARRYDLTIASLEWEAGAMPTDAEIADLQALVDETGARILLWEADPPDAAFEITAALGLKNVVFAPLAHGVEGHSYFESFTDALSEMAEAGVP